MRKLFCLDCDKLCDPSQTFKCSCGHFKTRHTNEKPSRESLDIISDVMVCSTCQKSCPRSNAFICGCGHKGTLHLGSNALSPIDSSPHAGNRTMIPPSSSIVHVHTPASPTNRLASSPLSPNWRLSPAVVSNNSPKLSAGQPSSSSALGNGHSGVQQSAQMFQPTNPSPKVASNQVTSPKITTQPGLKHTSQFSFSQHSRSNSPNVTTAVFSSSLSSTSTSCPALSTTQSVSTGTSGGVTSSGMIGAGSGPSVVRQARITGAPATMSMLSQQIEAQRPRSKNLVPPKQNSRQPSLEAASSTTSPSSSPPTPLPGSSGSIISEHSLSSSQPQIYSSSHSPLPSPLASVVTSSASVQTTFYPPGAKTQPASTASSSPANTTSANLSSPLRLPHSTSAALASTMASNNSAQLPSSRVPGRAPPPRPPGPGPSGGGTVSGTEQSPPQVTHRLSLPFRSPSRPSSRPVSRDWSGSLPRSRQMPSLSMFESEGSEDEEELVAHDEYLPTLGRAHKRSASMAATTSSGSRGSGTGPAALRSAATGASNLAWTALQVEDDGSPCVVTGCARGSGTAELRHKGLCVQHFREFFSIPVWTSPFSFLLLNPLSLSMEGATSRARGRVVSGGLHADALSSDRRSVRALGTLGGHVPTPEHLQDMITTNGKIIAQGLPQYDSVDVRSFESLIAHVVVPLLPRASRATWAAQLHTLCLPVFAHIPPVAASIPPPTTSPPSHQPSSPASNNNNSENSKTGKHNKTKSSSNNSGEIQNNINNNSYRGGSNGRSNTMTGIDELHILKLMLFVVSSLNTGEESEIVCRCPKIPCPCFTLRVFFASSGLLDTFRPFLMLPATPITRHAPTIRIWSLKVVWRLFQLVHVLPVCQRYEALQVTSKSHQHSHLGITRFEAAVKVACGVERGRTFISVLPVGSAQAPALDRDLFNALLEMATNQLTLPPPGYASIVANFTGDLAALIATTNPNNDTGHAKQMDQSTQTGKEGTVSPLTPSPPPGSVESQPFTPMLASRKIDLFRSQLVNPAVLPVLFSVLEGSPVPLRLECLSNLFTMLVGRPRASEVVVSLPDWQLWLFRLISDIPQRFSPYQAKGSSPQLFSPVASPLGSPISSPLIGSPITSPLSMTARRLLASPLRRESGGASNLAGFADNNEPRGSTNAGNGSGHGGHKYNGRGSGIGAQLAARRAAGKLAPKDKEGSKDKERDNSSGPQHELAPEVELIRYSLSFIKVALSSTFETWRGHRFSHLMCDTLYSLRNFGGGWNRKTVGAGRQILALMVGLLKKDGTRIPKFENMLNNLVCFLGVIMQFVIFTGYDEVHGGEEEYFESAEASSSANGVVSASGSGNSGGGSGVGSGSGTGSGFLVGSGGKADSDGDMEEDEDKEENNGAGVAVTTGEGLPPRKIPSFTNNVGGGMGPTSRRGTRHVSIFPTDPPPRPRRASLVTASSSQVNLPHSESGKGSTHHQAASTSQTSVAASVGQSQPQTGQSQNQGGHPVEEDMFIDDCHDTKRAFSWEVSLDGPPVLRVGADGGFEDLELVLRCLELTQVVGFEHFDPAHHPALGPSELTVFKQGHRAYQFLLTLAGILQDAFATGTTQPGLPTSTSSQEHGWEGVNFAKFATPTASNAVLRAHKQVSELLKEKSTKKLVTFWRTGINYTVENERDRVVVSGCLLRLGKSGEPEEFSVQLSRLFLSYNPGKTHKPNHKHFTQVKIGKFSVKDLPNVDPEDDSGLGSKPRESENIINEDSDEARGSGSPGPPQTGGLLDRLSRMASSMRIGGRQRTSLVGLSAFIPGLSTGGLNGGTMGPGDLPPATLPTGFSFLISTPKDSFILGAPSPEVKREWISALERRQTQRAVGGGLLDLASDLNLPSVTSSGSGFLGPSKMLARARSESSSSRNRSSSMTGAANASPPSSSSTLALASSDTVELDSQGEGSSVGGRSRTGTGFAPVLKPKSQVSQCERCGESFSVVRRKHNCRGCGAVVCANCSTHKFLLKHLAATPQRVCDPCLEELTHREERDRRLVVKMTQSRTAKKMKPVFGPPSPQSNEQAQPSTQSATTQPIPSHHRQPSLTGITTINPLLTNEAKILGVLDSHLIITTSPASSPAPAQPPPSPRRPPPTGFPPTSVAQPPPSPRRSPPSPRSSPRSSPPTVTANAAVVAVVPAVGQKTNPLKSPPLPPHPLPPVIPPHPPASISGSPLPAVPPRPASPPVPQRPASPVKTPRSPGSPAESSHY